MCTLQEARQNKLLIEFRPEDITTPVKPGIHVFNDINLDELVPYIDWTPFFQTWELAGRFPKILDDEIVGEQARHLFEDAKQMLNELLQKKSLTAKAVVGIFEANSIGDEIVLNQKNSDNKNFVFQTLRQQTRKAQGQPNLALADFIAPQGSGIQDYIGCFAVSAGFGIEKLTNAYEGAHDDYSSIMIKALADRLAEALAEYMHHEVRTRIWGYAANEQLSTDELIDEAYRGIRPAPGYPACPDHLEKLTIWELLEVEKNTGITLTESLAMYPTASVSGYYFGHPQSKYFGLGKITEEQVKKFAERKGIKFEEASKWLSPNII
jgi:5-methyltetrahydrofolate--homocysteine methyltransferase